MDINSNRCMDYPEKNIQKLMSTFCFVANVYTFFMLVIIEQGRHETHSVIIRDWHLICFGFSNKVPIYNTSWRGCKCFFCQVANLTCACANGKKEYRRNETSGQFVPYFIWCSCTGFPSRCYEIITKIIKTPVSFW